MQVRPVIHVHLCPYAVEDEGLKKIYDRFQFLADLSGHTINRVMSCLLGRYPNDPGWKSASKISSSMSLSAPCTTRSRIAAIERTRTLPPSFGISCFRAGSGT